MNVLNCPACGNSGLGEPYLNDGIVFSACKQCHAEVEMTPLGEAKDASVEFGVLDAMSSAPLYKTGRYRLPGIVVAAALDS